MIDERGEHESGLEALKHRLVLPFSKWHLLFFGSLLAITTALLSTAQVMNAAMDAKIAPRFDTEMQLIRLAKNLRSLQDDRPKVKYTVSQAYDGTWTVKCESPFPSRNSFTSEWSFDSSLRFIPKQKVTEEFCRQTQ